MTKGDSSQEGFHPSNSINVIQNISQLKKKNQMKPEEKWSFL